MSSERSSKTKLGFYQVKNNLDKKVRAEAKEYKADKKPDVNHSVTEAMKKR